MIKLKNCQEFEFQLRKEGTLTGAATILDVTHAPFAGWVKAIYAVLGTADGTSGQGDIQVNGTSMASSGNLLVFGTTAAAVITNLSPNPFVVAKGDVITLSMPVTTGGQAANLSVLIVLSKRAVATTEKQTISADFDNVD